MWETADIAAHFLEVAPQNEYAQVPAPAVPPESLRPHKRTRTEADFGKGDFIEEAKALGQWHDV